MALLLPDTLIIPLKSPSVLPFGLYILVSFATQILEIPLLRLYENAICNRQYRSIRGDSVFVSNYIDEIQCKIPAVQDQLGDVVGWKICFDALPGLLSAIVYGFFADKYGRRIVLLSTVTGILLMLLWTVFICSFDTIFPVKLIWISSVFLLIGGGQRVFCSMIYAIVSDLHGPSTRTKYLYLLAAGPHLNRLLTPPIAGALMKKSLYIPFWISISTYLTSLLIAFMMNDSDHKNNRHNYMVIADEEYSTSILEESISHRTKQTSPALAPNSSSYLKALKFVKFYIQQVINLFHSPASRFCLATFFVKRIAFSSESFVFQYASEKFLWPLHQTTYLRVATASGAIFATLIACPASFSILSRRGFVTHKLDFSAVRISLIIVLVSFFCAWKANSGLTLALAMISCGLGEGIEPALQGLVTFLTDSSRNAQLFTTIAVADTMGELIGGPLTARLMAVGRMPNHPSDGLSFLASSIMFGMLSLWAYFVKPEP